MPRTKSASTVAEKWGKVTPGATRFYKEGVKNPRVDWAEATSRSEQIYAEGVQNAITEGRFGRGVQKAGSGKWQKNAIEKGGARFGQGVMAAKSTYATAIQPVLQAIEGTELPPRYAKGDPRNIQRVAVMAESLHKLRTNN